MKSFKSMIPDKLGFDDVLSFGEYKGRTVSSIVELDQEYVIWHTIFGTLLFTQEVIDRAFELHDIPQ